MANHRATGRAQMRPLAKSPQASHRDASSLPVGAVKVGVLGVLATATIAVPVASAAASQGGVAAALPGELVGAAHAAPAQAAPAAAEADAAVQLPASSNLTASLTTTASVTAEPAPTATATTAPEQTAGDETATAAGAATDVEAGAAADVAPATGGYIKPVDAPITSNYGWRIHPTLGYKKLHDGVDFGAACGTPAEAVQAGVVTEVSTNSASGNRVFVDHGNGVITGYFHLQAFKVKEGDRVAQGQTVGLVGSTGRSTGCHLHFSKVDASGNYSDPMSLFR